LRKYIINSMEMLSQAGKKNDHLGKTLKLK